jgi:glycosyltransferase involved in cell wall biosynthesis
MGYACFHNSLELARRGHDVTIFTLDYGRMTYDNDPADFEIVRFNAPIMYGDGGVVPQLYFHLKGYDVIHLHYPLYGSAEYVYLASLLRRQKYFLTYHMDVYGTTLLKRLIIDAYDRLLLKRLLGRAELLGALSMEHLKSTRAAGLVDWNKVVELPNGVDSGKFRPREKDRGLTEKYGLEDKVVALFVGNLYAFKGMHLLIEAISRIKDDKVVLLVVGGGYEEMRYREQVKKMGLKQRVIFAGTKSPDEDLPLYYNLGDFLVLPSTHSESFGLVAVEAMASGKPVVVSSLPGPSGLVNDGKVGLIAKVGDVDDLKEKIELLAYDETRRLEMGKAARQKVVEKYSWLKIGDRLEEVLIRVAGK